MSEQTEMPPMATTHDAIEAAPWDVVLAALTRQAAGVPLTEDEEDACQYAGTLMAGAQLVRAGVDPEVVFEMFDQRDYTLRFKWTRETDEVEVIVDWDDDGEVES